MLGLQTQTLDFVDEFLDVAELAVNRGETNIGHLIETAQMLHDFVSDGSGWDFIAMGFDQFIDHFIDGAFDRFAVNGAFFTSFIDPGGQFAPVEGFITPIPF